VLATGLFSAAAQAAPFSSATTFIDISSLQVQTTGTATFALNGLDDYNGTVEVPSQFAETFIAEDLSVDHLAVDTADIEMQAGSHLAAVSVADSDGFADSFASVFLGYDVDGVGDVIVSFDYSINAGLFDTTDPLAFAFAQVALDAVGDSDDALLDFNGSLADISNFLDGSLSVTIAVSGSDSDDIFLSAVAVAQTNIAPLTVSVPAPTSALLLLPGLLLGWRLRRDR